MSIRFFISLYIILFSSYGQLAHTHSNDMGDTVKNNLTRSESVSMGIVPNHQSLLIGFSHSYSGKHHFKFRATHEEGEEDEVASLKNNLDISNHFAVLFYNQISRYCFQNIKKCLLFRKPFSYCSSTIYILFRVLRI